MNFIKEYWGVLNEIFEGNPIMLFISLGILYAVSSSLKAIPQLIKWKRGEIKKDKAERDKARDTMRNINSTVSEIDKSVKKQNSHLETLNGNFQNHCANYNIHVPKEELVTKELFKNETKHINESIKAIFNKF